MPVAVHTAIKDGQVSRGRWVGGQGRSRELLFNEHKDSVLQNERVWEIGSWDNMDVPNITKLYIFKWLIWQILCAYV